MGSPKVINPKAKVPSKSTGKEDAIFVLKFGGCALGAAIALSALLGASVWVFRMISGI